MSETNNLSAPPDAMGALYFLPGQYLFKRFENGREVAKALSSEQISRAFREFKTDTGWLTRRILRYREEPEGNYLIAYEPARVRHIWIETNDGDVRKVEVPLPTLILLGKKNEYYLWAAKGKNVSAKTPIANAPLPNMGGEWNGKICFGRNEVPECRADTVDAVWNLIFDAPFNKDSANNKCRSEREDVRKLLFALAEKRAKTFPAAELIEYKTTIGEIWSGIVENKRQTYF